MHLLSFPYLPLTLCLLSSSAPSPSAPSLPACPPPPIPPKGPLLLPGGDHVRHQAHTPVPAPPADPLFRLGQRGAGSVGAPADHSKGAGGRAAGGARGQGCCVQGKEGARRRGFVSWLLGLIEAARRWHRDTHAPLPHTRTDTHAFLHPTPTHITLNAPPKHPHPLHARTHDRWWQ